MFGSLALLGFAACDHITNLAEYQKYDIGITFTTPFADLREYGVQVAKMRERVANLGIQPIKSARQTLSIIRATSSSGDCDSSSDGTMKAEWPLSVPNSISVIRILFTSVGT